MAVFRNVTEYHELEVSLHFHLTKIRSSEFALWLILQFLLIFDPTIFVWLKLRTKYQLPVSPRGWLQIFHDCSIQGWLILELRGNYLGSCHYNTTKKKSNSQYLFRNLCNWVFHSSNSWERFAGTNQNTEHSAFPMACLWSWQSSLLSLLNITRRQSLKDRVKSNSSARYIKGKVTMSIK